MYHWLWPSHFIYRDRQAEMTSDRMLTFEPYFQQIEYMTVYEEREFLFNKLMQQGEEAFIQKCV